MGKNIANPVSMINAAADMLEHLELNHHAILLRDAIRKTICEERVHTPGRWNLLFVKEIFVTNIKCGKDKLVFIFRPRWQCHKYTSC